MYFFTIIYFIYSLPFSLKMLKREKIKWLFFQTGKSFEDKVSLFIKFFR